MLLFMLALLALLAAAGVDAAAGAFVPRGLSVDGTTAKPNVLVMLIDDMGWSDLGAYGRKNVSTPHIDGLIADGIKCRHRVPPCPMPMPL